LRNQVYELVSEKSNYEQLVNIHRKRETLFEALERLNKIGGWEWDVEHQTMYWTDETYRIHGFNPDDIEPGSTTHIEHSIECYDEKDRSIILNAFNKCISKGKSYELEFPFTSAKGKKIWIRTTAHN